MKEKMKTMDYFRIAILGVLLLVSPVLAADESGTESNALWVGGSNEQIYLIEQGTTETGPVLRVGSQGKESKAMVWHEVIGRLKGAVTIEDQLFLSFEDGTLMRFNGSYVFPQIPAGGQVEQMVVDARRNRLYVLASHDGFSDPTADPNSTRPTTVPADKSGDEAGQDSTWAIYELSGGQWNYCCSLPNGLGINAQPMLVVENECMDLFVRPDPFSNQLYHWGYGKDVWVAGPKISLPEGSGRVWAMSIRGVQAVVISREVEGGDVLDLYHFIDDALEKIVTLGVDETTPLVLTGNYAISESPDQSMTIAYATSKKGVIAVSQWSAYGQPLGDTEMIAISSEDSTYEPSTWVLMAISVGLFLLVMTRKSSGPQEIVLPAGMVFAPFWRRGAAFVIDFMPAVFLSMIFWWDYFAAMDQSANLLEYLQEVQHDSTMLMINFFVYSVYVGYSIVMEGLWGRTLGKRMMGLEVRQLTDMNQRPGWANVVGRNLIKVMELNFPPFLLVLFFTRNRQRVGDIVARTVVVCRGS